MGPTWTWYPWPPEGERAVIADGHGQEMKLEIGVGHIVVAADETTGFEVVGGRRPFTMKKPLVAHQRLVVPLHGRVHGHRGLFAGVLDIHFQVVLEVLPYPGKIEHRADAQGLQFGGVAHTGNLKQLGVN